MALVKLGDLGRVGADARDDARVCEVGAFCWRMVKHGEGSVECSMPYSAVFMHLPSSLLDRVHVFCRDGGEEEDGMD